MVASNTGDRQSAQGYILLHVFLGPVFANLAILANTLITMPPTGPIRFNPMTLWDVSYILLGMLMLSWVFGFVPAIMHAASMLILHRLMGATIIWFLLTPFVGWLVTFVPLVILGGTDPKIFTEGPHMALVGSAAALGCLAVAWMRGTYPVRGKEARALAP